MFGPAAVVIFTFTAVGSVVSDTYRKGGEAVLSPGSVSGTITSVTWKHGPDIAVEWYGEDTIAYRDFKGRCEVDKKTGELRISKLSLKDSGSYTAEINSRIVKMIDVTVLTAVPKPTISTQYNPEETQCTLTCEASITDDMGTVSYTWETGDRKISSSIKQLHISKEDPDLTGKPISCQLENPVSRERSDNFTNPFTNESSGGFNETAAWIALAVLIVSTLVVLTVFVCWHKRRPANAEKSWREYFSTLDLRSCLKPGRDRATGGHSGEAGTETVYDRVPTKELEEIVSQRTKTETETNRETQENSSGAGTAAGSQEPGELVPQHNNIAAGKNPEEQKDPTKDQPEREPTVTHKEAAETPEETLKQQGDEAAEDSSRGPESD